MPEFPPSTMPAAGAGANRAPLAYSAADISALARSLRAGLAARTASPELPDAAARTLPSHVEMLNLLARAAGFRNFQHFRAEARVAAPPAAAGEPAEPAEPAPTRPSDAHRDLARCERALRLFDGAGVLMRWPTRRNQQILCLWMLWSRIPAGEGFSEKAINAVLTRWHAFGDYALLRREMVELGLMTRTRDGSDYRRVERDPPPQLAVLRSLMRARAR